jgi:hypothetical protein
MHPRDFRNGVIFDRGSEVCRLAYFRFAPKADVRIVPASISEKPFSGRQSDGPLLQAGPERPDEDRRAAFVATSSMAIEGCTNHIVKRYAAQRLSAFFFGGQ